MLVGTLNAVAIYKKKKKKKKKKKREREREKDCQGIMCKPFLQKLAIIDTNSAYSSAITFGNLVLFPC